jgi:hypothetical protein
VADSWWAAPGVQWDRDAFRKLAAKEFQRMNLDPEAARVSGLISLRGTALPPGIQHAVNAAGESN